MKKLRAALTAAVMVAVGLVSSEPAAALNTAYYVDCSAATNGSGTQSSPWNSLASVNAKPGGFSSGDRILLKRATTCNGTLNPSGSGASGSPIVVDAYGTGVRPAIVAPNSSPHAVKLINQSYWTISNLDISGSSRYGVFVTVTTGVVSGITLTGLNVHDVTGGTLDSKDTGLVVIAPTTDVNNTTSARFNNVLVDNVVAYNTTMWAGILVGSGNGGEYALDYSKRSTNVTVRNSTVYNVYGDGIVLFVLNNGLLERNLAHHTGVQPTYTIGTPNGIWTWACDGCVVQFNEAYANDSPAHDGGAFDVDFFSDNTTIQYNYGHDNTSYCVAVFAGFGYVTTNTTIRYNICANNGTEAGTDRGEVLFFAYGGGSFDGLAIYNNTFITNHGVFSNNGTVYSGTRPRFFKNNLVYSKGANPYGSYSTLSSDYNLWYYTGGPTTDPEPNSVRANPQLVNPNHTGNGSPGNAFTLTSTSPAIDAGTIIPNAGTRDYYGNPILRGNGVDIGAGESPFSRGSERLANSGFEAGNTGGWTGGVVTTTDPRAGTYAAKVTGSATGMYRTISGLAPNTTYVFSAWLKADAGNTGYLYAKNFGGGEEVETDMTLGTAYAPATITFKTGATNTTAEIGLWRNPGSGSGDVRIDDVSLKPAAITSRVVNAGFESGTLSPWATHPSGGAVVNTNARTGTYASRQTGDASGIYQNLSGLTPNTDYVLTAWIKADAGNRAFLFAKSHGGTDIESHHVTSTEYIPVSIPFRTGATNTTAQIGLWRPTSSGTGAVYMDDVTLVTR